MIVQLEMACFDMFCMFNFNADRSKCPMPWLFEMIWSLFALVHQQQSINWWKEHMNQKKKVYVQVCKVILARQILQNRRVSMPSW